MIEKIALCTQVNDDYFDGFLVMLYSLYKHNSYLKEFPFIILNDRLSNKNIVNINNIKNNIIIKDINYELYKKANMSKTISHIQSAYFKLDIFNFIEYDKIIFLDSDLLIIGDVSVLLKEYVNYILGVDTLNINKNINTGVMCLNMKNIKFKYKYLEILKEINKTNSHADQSVINRVFKNKFNFIDFKYNAPKNLIIKNNININNINIIHFAGPIKPWNISIDVIEKNRDLEKSNFIDMFDLWEKYKKEAYEYFK